MARGDDDLVSSLSASEGSQSFTARCCGLYIYLVAPLRALHWKGLSICRPRRWLAHCGDANQSEGGLLWVERTFAAHLRRKGEGRESQSSSRLKRSCRTSGSQPSESGHGLLSRKLQKLLPFSSVEEAPCVGASTCSAFDDTQMYIIGGSAGFLCHRAVWDVCVEHALLGLATNSAIYEQTLIEGWRSLRIGQRLARKICSRHGRWV